MGRPAGSLRHVCDVTAVTSTSRLEEIGLQNLQGQVERPLGRLPYTLRDHQMQPLGTRALKTSAALAYGADAPEIIQRWLHR